MRTAGLACAAFALLACAPSSAEPEDVRALFASLAEGEGPVVRGADGWLLLRSGLRHLSLERFWGEHAAAASRATRDAWADPLPAIVDFHRQLDAAGIELWFVPVPVKAAVHPEAVPGLPERLDENARADAPDRAFYDVLVSQGVQVVDLWPALREQATAGERAAYCRQDSHWSGAGAERAARVLAERLAGRDGLASQPRRELASEMREVEIRGDLWQLLEDPDLPRERLRLRFVGERGVDGALEPVTPSRESPVLLLGDSHNLVFHAGGDLHARGAGLPDQLALELGFPVDLIGVRGSGATPSRVELLRRPDALAGKKLVIWLLSARELTESAQGWRVLPIAR